MSVTTGLTALSVLVRRPNDPDNIRRTCVAGDLEVKPGDAVYSHGDPESGQICDGAKDGRGRGGVFYGIALAGAPPRTSFQVLVRGRLEGYATKDAFAVGTQFYMGDTAEKLSTFPNDWRPDPIATLVADETDGTHLLDVHGYVEGE